MQKVIPILPISIPKRECGDCTKCCDGWLIDEIYGYKMSKGEPCHFLGERCTIYEDRPEDPCRLFFCGWMGAPEEFPLWMKPNKIDLIIVPKNVNGVIFVSVVDAGDNPNIIAKNWLIHWALNKKINLYYTLDGIPYKIGSPEFLSAKFI